MDAWSLYTVKKILARHIIEFNKFDKQIKAPNTTVPTSMSEITETSMIGVIPEDPNTNAGMKAVLANVSSYLPVGDRIKFPFFGDYGFVSRGETL